MKYYELALKANPRDTEAMRARKNLAAEKALRGRPKDGGGSGLDTESFLRAARGERLDGDPPVGR